MFFGNNDSWSYPTLGTSTSISDTVTNCVACELLWTSENLLAMTYLWQIAFKHVVYISDKLLVFIYHPRHATLVWVVMTGSIE